MKALDYQATIDQPAPCEDHATLIQQIWDQIETRPVQETSRDLLDLMSREDCDFQSQITAADFSGLVAECGHVDPELALLLLRDMIKLGGGDWEDACYKEPLWNFIDWALDPKSKIDDLVFRCLAALMRRAENPDRLLQMFFDAVQDREPSEGLIEFLLAAYHLMAHECAEQLSDAIYEFLTNRGDDAALRVLSLVVDAIERTPTKYLSDFALQVRWLPLLQEFAVQESNRLLATTAMTVIASFLEMNIAVPVFQFVANFMTGRQLAIEYPEESLDLAYTISESVPGVAEKLFPRGFADVMVKIAGAGKLTFNGRVAAVRFLVSWILDDPLSQLSTLDPKEIGAVITTALVDLEPLPERIGLALITLADACQLDRDEFLTQIKADGDLIARVFWE